MPGERPYAHMSDEGLERRWEALKVLDDPFMGSPAFHREIAILAADLFLERSARLRERTKDEMDAEPYYDDRHHQTKRC